MTLTMQIRGMREAQRALQEVPRRTYHLHLRKAMNKAGGMLRNAASNFARVDTGLLKKSIKVKVKIPDASFNKAHHGKPAYAVIGPGRGFGAGGRFMRRTASGRTVSHGKANRAFLETVKLARGAGGGARESARAAKEFTGRKYSDATFRNPSRYAHLVEKGTPRVRARPFLSSAVRIVGPAAQRVVVEAMRSGVLQEAQREFSRGIK
jgi:HK97 gp10 family phage protein